MTWLRRLGVLLIQLLLGGPAWMLSRREPNRQPDLSAPTPGEEIGDSAPVYYCPNCAVAYADQTGGCDYCPKTTLEENPPNVEDLGEWRPVVEVRDHLEAETLRIALEAENMPVKINDLNPVQAPKAGMLGPRHKVILVPENCLPRARDIVDAARGN